MTSAASLPKSELVDLTTKICKAQSPTNVPAGLPENCMQYLMTVASDLSKLIGHIKGMAAVTDLKSYFVTVCPNMSAFCLEFFTHLVVNESGQTHTDAINFFKDCLLEMLSPEEKNGFICNIIDTFLSKPISHISQRAVIEATVLLGVSDKVLIAYMADKLSPYMDETQAAKKDLASPITMMFSVLALALSTYEALKPIPVVNELKVEPEQLEGMTYDKQYEKLFYVSLWVCKNTQKLFSKPE